MYIIHFLLCSSPVPAESGPPIGSSVAGAMTSAEADSSQEEGEHQEVLEQRMSTECSLYPHVFCVKVYPHWEKHMLTLGCLVR